MLSAVRLSPNQFWLGPNPKSLEQRVDAQRLAHAVEQPVGGEDEQEQDGDRGRARDRREVERGPEERLAADLLVDDDREEQAERHLERHDEDRVVEGVLDRLPEDRVAEQATGSCRCRGTRCGPRSPPVPEADVQGVEDLADVEDEEQDDRDGDQRVARRCASRCAAPHAGPLDAARLSGSPGGHAASSCLGQGRGRRPAPPRRMRGAT